MALHRDGCCSVESTVARLSTGVFPVVRRERSADRRRPDTDRWRLLGRRPGAALCRFLGSIVAASPPSVTATLGPWSVLLSRRREPSAVWSAASRNECSNPLESTTSRREREKKNDLRNYTKASIDLTTLFRLFTQRDAMLRGNHVKYTEKNKKQWIFSEITPETA